MQKTLTPVNSSENDCFAYDAVEEAEETDTRHANGWPHQQWGTSFSPLWLFFVAVVILQTRYDGWGRIVVAVNGNARTFSEQVIASII